MTTSMNIAAQSAPVRAQDALHGFVCHSACIYWACFSMTGNAILASESTERVLRTLCLKCTEGHLGHVVDSASYGTMLNMCCTSFVPGTDKVSVGDVILFGQSWRRPTHSVVVTQLTENDIMVRGFNNFGSFGTSEPPPPPSVSYDPHDRALSRRVSLELPLWRVKQRLFVAAVQAQMFKTRAAGKTLGKNAFSKLR